MRTIHFIGGEKGGVGKSVMSRVLAQYFIDNNIPFNGFDTDKSHGALMRFYSDFTSPITIDNYESLDNLVEILSENPDTHIVVDLAAQHFAPLSAWIDDSGLFDTLQELNTAAFFWHVMDDGMDSLNLLDKLLDTYGTKVSYVILLNLGRGTNFKSFEESQQKQKALEMNASVMKLRKLHEGCMRKIDALSISFWAAINNKSPKGTCLSVSERQRVKVWLDYTYQDLDILLTR